MPPSPPSQPINQDLPEDIKKAIEAYHQNANENHSFIDGLTGEADQHNGDRVHKRSPR